jgi:hypothetical protein
MVTVSQDGTRVGSLLPMFDLASFQISTRGRAEGVSSYNHHQSK